MASYPTAPKSFTVKSAGDTIQPAHVNDLQDEVAAIEGGLLNGTAPLNSSNSTVVNLSVSGNCTVAGTLTAATIIGLRPGSHVRAYAGSPVQFGTGSTGTPLAIDQRTLDLSSEYDSTTFTFTPKSSGVYLLTARGMCITASLSMIYSQVWVNDTIVAQWGYAEGTTEVNLSIQANMILHLSSGSSGSVQWRAYAGSTARLSSGVPFTGLEIVKLF